jgi:hypothetical protein
MDKSIKNPHPRTRGLRLSDLLSIRKSAWGLGIFAKKNIPAAHFVLQIQGGPLHFIATTRLGDKESYCLQTGENSYIYLEAPFCYFNHSCDPNCGIREGSSVFSLRDISRGEELCWDYSTSMLERHWTMGCSCGTAECRHIISDFDLLPESFQQQYLALGIVMPFIEQELAQRGSQQFQPVYKTATGF